MKKVIVIVLGLILSLSLIASSCAPTAGGGTAAEFFKGKTIKIIVPFKPGSGADKIGRIVAHYLPEYTGSTVVVENMPGQIGMKGTNYLYTTAEPDGLTLLVSALTLVLGRDLLDEAGHLWTSGDFSYVRGFGNEGYVLAVKKGGRYTSIEDFRAAKGLILVSSSATDIIAAKSYMLIEALELDAKLLTGAGRAEVFLAIQREEVDAAVVGMPGYITRKELMLPLIAVELERQPAAPDVRALSEVTKLSKDHEKMLSQLFYKSSHVLFGPPAMPKDRLEYLIQAIEKIEARDDFLKDMAEVKTSPLSTVSTEEIQKRIENVMKNKEWFKELMPAWEAKYRA